MARTRNSGRTAKRNAVSKMASKNIQKPAVSKPVLKVKLVQKPATLTYNFLVLDAIKDLQSNTGKFSSVKAILNRIHQFYPRMDLKDHLIKRSVKSLFNSNKIKNSQQYPNSFALSTFATAVVPKNSSRRQAPTAQRRPAATIGLFGGTMTGGLFGANPSGISGGLFGNNSNTTGTGTIIANVAVPPNCTIHQPYDIHLNLTNHAANMDKFMKMQIVKDANNFYFINNWGKNGTAGQSQVKTFSNQLDAEKEMEKKFKTKTGKSWLNRNSASTSDANARSGHGHYEMVQRLQAAGAGFSTKKGSVAVSLMWDHSDPAIRNDLDLWVETPSGEKIGYSHKHSRCGGSLDVDRMQNAPQPVENIVWLGKAPVGKYKVRVHNYSLSHTKEIGFQVSIVMNGGKREMFDLKMPGICKHWVDVKEFEFK